MSGAEALGLISGIITVIEASIKLYKIVKDSSGLPPNLRDAASRLPLILDSLTIAAHGIQQDSQPLESYAALDAVLQACNDRAHQLYQIFAAIVPPIGATRSRRYLMAVRSFSQIDKANVLVEGILTDLQVLTFNHVVKAAIRGQIEENIGIETKPDSKKLAITLINTGVGRQYAHMGQGNQNITSNKATQVNGTFNGGTFNFTQT
jgi:hypothetical protein